MIGADFPCTLVPSFCLPRGVRAFIRHTKNVDVVDETARKLLFFK